MIDRRYIIGLVFLLLLCALPGALPAQDDDPPVEDPPIEDVPVDEVVEDVEAEGEVAEEVSDAIDGMPVIPSVDEIEAQPEQPFVATDFRFKIAVVGDYASELNTTTGVHEQIKTPLFLLDPSTGGTEMYARNFPAKIIDSSDNGSWVIGIAPSSAVEGSSGNKDRECSVSLNLQENSIKLIKEFPRHSNFQALFLPDDNDTIYFSVNEPAVENKIIRYELTSREESVVNVEGNRFYLYGYKLAEPRGLWVQDPLSLKHYPVVLLLDPENAAVGGRVEFPGSSEIISSPDGNMILAIVNRAAEASIGYYDALNSSFTRCRIWC